MSGGEEKNLTPVRADLRLHRLFLSRANFEQRFLSANRRPLPPADEELTLNFTLKMRSRERTDEGDLLGVELGISVEPDLEKNQPYAAEVAYAGEFWVDGAFADLSDGDLAEGTCAAVLFPYVRETLGSLTSRGTSGPLTLPVLNISAMLAASRAQGDTTETETEDVSEP